MNQAVILALEAYLGAPTAERFEALQRAFMNSPDYSPYDRNEDEVFALMGANKLEEALAKLMQIMPEVFLSPGAHRLASFLNHKLSREYDARMEMGLSQALLEALARTGDGTRERPFRVTRTSDEYELLEHLGKDPETQALVKDGGRILDLLVCKDGTRLWFDVTPLLEFLDRTMKDAPTRRRSGLGLWLRRLRGGA